MYKRNKNIFQVNKIRISIINTLNIMQYVINIEMKYRRKRAESESPSLSLKYGWSFAHVLAKFCHYQYNLRQENSSILRIISTLLSFICSVSFLRLNYGVLINSR